MSFAFMPIYTGDYIRDTQHLDCSEHGIYFKFLMHCWDQKGPLPRDERKLQGICNARSGSEIEAMRRIVSEFFVLMDDGFYNRRMQKEIERAGKISHVRSEAGKSGYQAKAKQLLSKCQTSAKQVPLPPPLPSQLPPPRQPESQTLLSVAEAPDRYPACPISEIQKLYHEVLPMLPTIRVRSSARDANLGARWRQLFAEGHADSHARGLELFREYFERVSKSKFLTGFGSAQNGRKPFRADLTWLVNATNFAKVIERDYA